MVVPVGPDGKIQLYNLAGNADVIVDVTGWYSDSSNAAATGASYVPITPTRICDTRSASPPSVASNQCNAWGTSSGAYGPGATKAVQVAGTSGAHAVAGIPLGATAAVLNVAVTSTTFPSFLSVWPDDGSPGPTPLTSTGRRHTIPNLVIATLASSGANGGRQRLQPLWLGRRHRRRRGLLPARRSVMLAVGPGRFVTNAPVELKWTPPLEALLPVDQEGPWSDASDRCGSKRAALRQVAPSKISISSIAEKQMKKTGSMSAPIRSVR